MPTEDLFTSYIRMPPFKAGVQYPAGKAENDMYSFSHLGFNVSDVHERFEGIKGPLTLFAPFPHEDDTDDREVHDDAEPQSDVIELDRPVTPIIEEIKKAPKTFNQLAKLVRRRISAKPHVEHLSIEDQQALAAIIMGEVNGIWSDFRVQVSDPFMTMEENKELQRRITVHIVTVCEKLFSHFIDKAQILNKRGVFSGPANMSRLKAQLSLDANKLLNVLTVRRYIIEDMRGLNKEDAEVTDSKKPFKQPYKAPNRMTHHHLVQASRPKSEKKKQWKSRRGGELSEMQAKMPTLDTSKLLEIIANLPEKGSDNSPADTTSKVASLSDNISEGQTSEKQNGVAGRANRRPSEDVSREAVILKRSNSVPQLEVENLLEELGIDSDGRHSAASLTTPRQDGLQVTKRDDQKQPTPRGPGTRDYAAQDLNRLATRSKFCEAAADDEDLPPLIQALTRSSRHDGKKELLQQQLRELEEQERAREEAERVIREEPTHPQPATVATKMANQMIVRASDIRVSDRVCLSSVTLEKNATVYNDLIDEIDPMTVKRLDSNLFLGDEITEVYHEIMKTVPSDHLDLENDPLVEPSADSLNMAAMASSLLRRKKDDRIINPTLHHKTGPPWGELDIMEWAKGASPPQGMSSVQNGALDDLDDTGVKAPPGGGGGGGAAAADGSGADGGMNDFMARSYASWLLWWKSTVNSDDYMKYLSTQETDYMGVVFHFYNSEDEDDEELSPSRASKRLTKHEEEHERKMVNLRSQKNEFKEGFWNVNSVMLGGLGKDPHLEEDEEESRTKTPFSEQVASTKVLSTKAKIISRKQLHAMSMQKEEDPQVSVREGARTRMSRATHLSSETARVSQTKGGRDNVIERLTPQDRLEKVWNALFMPDNLRLDMAIKYSSDSYHLCMEEAILAWETATKMILKREGQIAKLENFERLASDPNRFFEKGQRGLSVARLEEAKIRSTIYKKIDSIDIELKKLLENVHDEYNDNITFQGRIYLEKMKWDRTEMLYWLQEERKQQAIELEARMKQIPQPPLSMIQLAPLTI